MKVKEKLFDVDSKWVNKYHMSYGTCPKCGAGCYARIESLTFVIFCREGHKPLEFPFNEEIPAEFKSPITDQWQAEMKKEYIKYILKNPGINTTDGF